MHSCVKCSAATSFYPIDASTNYYCEQCFLKIMKHKFFFAFGKHRIFKGEAQKQQRMALIYDGGPESALLLSLARQGISAKKLPAAPKVVVLLSTCHEEELQGRLCEAVEMIARERLDEDGWGWEFVHSADILSEPQNGGNSNNGEVPCERLPILHLQGRHKIPDYCALLDSIKSASTRKEVCRLLNALLMVRTARRLGCPKLVSAENAESLANTSIVALCFGRGASLAEMTATVDERPVDIQTIRPLRDISMREITALHQLEGTSHLCLSQAVQATTKQQTSERGSGTVQQATSNFLTSLRAEGYPATVTTVLSVSSKLEALTSSPDEPHCPLCLTKSSGVGGGGRVAARNGATEVADEKYRLCCQACASLLQEIGNEAHGVIFSRVLSE